MVPPRRSDADGAPEAGSNAGSDADDAVSRSDLVADLREIGVESGTELVVHASLSSLGWVSGGAAAVVDALCEVTGSDGTVAVPTFTPPSVVETEPFDPATMRSRTGAITEALRARPDARRSEHPTHSVAALGPAAGELTRDHRLDRSLGADSPLHRLAQRGGQVLLLGVGHERNSTLHVAEALADLPYKTGTNRVLVRDRGEVRTVETARVGCGKGFPAVEPLARDAGIVRRGTVGAADAQLVPAAAIIDLTAEVLADDPGFLLCSDPGCWWCPDARRTLASSRDSG